MLVTPPQTRLGLLRRVCRRLRSESGFTMIVALGVLTVTTLLTAAVFLTVQGDASLTRADLSGKQAYAAAQSGLQAYLYQLNDNASNSTWWETCTNDTLAQTAVPGTSTGATYSYAPVAVSPYTSCSTTNAVASLIDPTTGTLRMEFTGYSGTAKRTIVASLRTLSPLSFLWYTVYETEDSSINSSGCQVFYYQSGGPDPSCIISWVTGDHMNGPMYTQDQFYVPSGNAPTFGRSGSKDAIASQEPSNTNASEICASDNCYGAVVSNPEPDVAQQVPLPADNSNLLTDATNHGKVFSGTTTLTVSSTVNPNVATGWNCPSSSASAACTAVSVNLANFPIIYATNASGCSTSYDPTSVSYPTNNTGHYYGPCGDIYISGTYSTPMTIAAADDVILTGSLTTTEDGSGNPTGSATLGLVANQYVRVMHTCSSNPNVTIDAAILTLQHSFFVDNFGCGGLPQGQLTVHGAIAQYFRGIVGTVGNSGYLKNYNYDDRLALILPPYLFDLQNTEWTVFRETLCSQTLAAGTAGSCS
jgi:Tfp pilus assembly protein PilX